MGALTNCCFCAAQKKDRKYFFVSGVTPVAVCDQCVNALNHQLFNVELQVRDLNQPKVKQ